MVWYPGKPRDPMPGVCFFGGGQTGTATTTTINKPPEYAEENLQLLMDEARHLYKQPGPEYYPGSTVVPLAPETEMALGAQTNRAIAGNPLLPQAQKYAGDVLGGSFLSAGNPYFQGAFDAFARPTMDAISGRMARAGRLGSGAETSVMARELGDIGSRLAFSNYERERGVQDNMARFAPELAQADYDDILRLAQAGMGWEQQARAELQSDVDRWQFYQQRPWDKLAQLGTLTAGGVYGGTSQQKQPIYSSGAGQFLGGLTSVAGMALPFLL